MAGLLAARSPRSAWLKAWLVCGTLDILFATIMTLIAHKDVSAMLRGVAMGPFGDGAKDWGMVGSLLGLATHFTLMAAMVSVYFMLARHTALGKLPWLVAGALYGVALWLVMYGIVLPARFSAPFPDPDHAKAFLWFLPHVVCVGWPLAYIARARPARFGN